MRGMDEPTDAVETALSRRRLTVLAISSLIAPALLLLQGAVSGDDIDWLAIGAVAVVVFLLVLVRIAGLVGKVQDQADQLSDLVMRDDLTGLPNRRFLEELGLVVSPGRSVAGRQRCVVAGPCRAEVMFPDVRTRMVPAPSRAPSGAPTSITT
jgi:hypothetical protein